MDKQLKQYLKKHYNKSRLQHSDIIMDIVIKNNLVKSQDIAKGYGKLFKRGQFGKLIQLCWKDERFRKKTIAALKKYWKSKAGQVHRKKLNVLACKPKVKTHKQKISKGVALWWKRRKKLNEKI